MSGIRKRLVDGASSNDDNEGSTTSLNYLYRRSPKVPFVTPSEVDESNSSHLSLMTDTSAASLRTAHSGSEYYSKVMNNPDVQFDQVIQKGREYLAEIMGAIYRFRNSQSADIDLIDAESQIEKTLCEVTKLASQLQDYVEETGTRRNADSSIVSPRVISAVKSREASLTELFKGIRGAKREMQTARAERERKDLLNQWSPFDRSNRSGRDAEELMSDSTERLMNSKRILLETIQSSSATLGSLATSSQSIASNEGELHDQKSMISSAHSLLQKYGRRASTDKLLIWLAFIFFGFCALIVAYRRLF